MSGWDLTAGLKNLRSQVNARWPDRDTTTDGTIGNADHQDQTSGHNPDDTPGARPAWNGDPDSKPEVRAWDMDHDIREPGTTGQMLVDHIRKLSGLSKVIRYMIYKGKMYHERTGYQPEPSSGHETHIHFEGAWTQSGDDNTTFDFKLEQVGDSMSVQDVRDFFEGAAKAVKGDPAATSQHRADRDTLAAVARFGWGLDYAEQKGVNMAPYRFDQVDVNLSDIRLAISTIVPASGVITAEQIETIARLVAEDLAARLVSK